MLAFWLKFHWNLFLRIQFTIFQHKFRQWLGAVQATSHYLNQCWLEYRRIHASLGPNELTRTQLRYTHFPFNTPPQLLWSWIYVKNDMSSHGYKQQRFRMNLLPWLQWNIKNEIGSLDRMRTLSMGNKTVLKPTMLFERWKWNKTKNTKVMIIYINYDTIHISINTINI